MTQATEERPALLRNAPTLALADDGAHEPNEAPLWQESSFDGIVDPARGLAGIHRIGIQPNRGEANLYSWTQVDGKIVSQAKRTGLALPHGPVTNTALGGITFTTTDPLRRCHVRVDRDSAITDVVFESFTGPVQFNMDVAGATIGAGHYNSLGAVTGEIQFDGKSHPFDGVGFLDHSWGARDGGGILSHRWIMAVFNAANHLSVFPTIGPRGRAMLGHVVLDGELSLVSDVRSEIGIADDGLRVDSLHAVITDRLGRTVELRGPRAGEYCTQPYGQGFFTVHSPMIYEGLGRFWQGIIEWSPMRLLPPWRRDALGLSASDRWLHWDGEQP